MAAETDPKKIFIVYDSHERALCEALQKLIQHWLKGVEVFYFQQSRREKGHDYRVELARRLKQTTLVIFLLSREFTGSQYCQSEAGAAAILEGEEEGGLKHLPILIPPVESKDINEVCPVLRVKTAIEVKSPDVEPRGLIEARNPHEFVLDLQEQLSLMLDVDEYKFRSGADKLVEAVEAELGEVIDGYEKAPDKEVTLKVWKSISRENKRASDRIVSDIKASLSKKYRDTTITLVGVSLKYSLRLLDRALREFSKESTAVSVQGKKRLTIRLVYMDDNSHILYALQDGADIKSIRKIYNPIEPQDVRFDQWPGLFENSPIELQPLESNVIDYIPPRIGILIDENVLYGGRCSFKEADGYGDLFHILVGEREYFYYTNADERGREMIHEFNSFLNVYRKHMLNGIELVESSAAWEERLMSCLDSRPTLKELTLVAQTFVRFSKLLIHALKDGKHVRIHAQNPESVSLDTVKMEIEGLQDRIREEGPYPKTARAEIYYYDYLPTFRAALIGEELLGVQMYVPSAPKSKKNRKASPVRIIASRYSSRFELLRSDLLCSFLNKHDLPPDEVLDLG